MKISSEQYVVYILRCIDGTLYTGMTNDPARRLLDHQTGRGGKYTSAHPGVKMEYIEKCETRGDALRREIIIKKLSRKEKVALIEKHEIALDKSKKG